MIIKLAIYNLIFPLAFLLYLPFFIRKLLRRGGLRHGFGERFGIFRAGKKRSLQSLDRPVWIHAVSVGEVVAATGFVERWQQRSPNLQFVLSTTTTTGHQEARRRLPKNTVLIYSPIDFLFPVFRTLALARPRLLVVFEVEIWPNLIFLTTRLRIPATLVNARLSDRSARGYARHSWFFRPLFQRLSWISAQSEEDARRLRGIVGEKVAVDACNTMKFDQTPDREATDLQPFIEQMFGADPEQPRTIWLAGSTHPGEEELVLRVFCALKARFPGLKLILAPRHHERTKEVEACLRNHRLDYRLRRERETGGQTAASADVLLLNTTGELFDFYAAADLVYVGKSLAGNSGGHNIIEPAIFGKPIIHGEKMDNFRLVAHLFKQAAACLEVADEQQLHTALATLLEQPEQRSELGRRARQLVEQNRGAMEKTLERLEKVAKNSGLPIPTEASSLPAGK